MASSYDKVHIPRWVAEYLLADHRRRCQLCGAGRSGQCSDTDESVYALEQAARQAGCTV